MRAKLTPVLACAVALATASASHAAIVPGVAVDGPDSDIVGNQSVQVDMAPDGTTALAYLKAEGGEDHVFASLFAGGAWGAPFQADTGSDTAASALRLAVANGGKVVVTYKLATGAVVSRIKPNAAAPFGVDQTLFANGEYANIDLAPNGNGYAAGRAPTNDVFADRLEGDTWTDVAAADTLNNDETQDAGNLGMKEIRVATSPDGASAVVAWGETVDAGENVFARRLTGTERGPAAGARVDSFPGGEVGVTPIADQPDVGIDGAGTAWVVFRQNIQYGMATRHRAIARPLTGDAFGDFQIIDGAPEPPTEGRDFTRVDVNAAGQGLVAHYGNVTNGAELASLAGGTWTRGALVNTEDNSSVPFVIPAIGENGSGIVAWEQGPAATESLLARTTFGGLGTVQTLSNPDFGPVAGNGPQAAAGPGGSAAVTFLQVEGMGGFRVVAAVVDLPQPPQPPPPPDGNGKDDRPEITDVRMAKRFRKGGALPRAARVRTGTRIRYTLSEAATVTLSFSRATRGRRVGGRCVKRTRRNRGRRPCTRFVRVRPTLAFANQQAGARRIRFAGRLTRRRSLRPGPHRLTLRARDAAGNLSQPVRVRFRLLPRG
jgi:hypothetical protein